MSTRQLHEMVMELWNWRDVRAGLSKMLNDRWTVAVVAAHNDRRLLEA
jgi:hypothetical protein